MFKCLKKSINSMRREIKTMKKNPVKIVELKKHNI